ncbi:hypothetical protein GDO86_011683 [Hymenochirus boettgeri]|uniref:Secernin-2 n=1 Tax=Hymenochirus boettgeri TaxID=247094 RepID=A0A8T2JHD3_9PIPI|nr:hypothetical protein GDO86_011683 [Hymenochirus boettgeri]KAG8442957.1 hypothetical protein GDO86_011683 [Hymenochirus boettgeri]
MAGAPPSFCFVAFPPQAKNGQILFGKNSARPRDEVQEVLYVPSSNHEPGSKVKCTYLEINQALKTHAVILSKPAWMWGAEMGANEHGVCIGNEANITREAASDTKLLLGMDLVRLGVERGTTAKEALDVIVTLLEEHGQGGNYFEQDNRSQSFHSSFLIVDRMEAWVLETVGKFWAAKKIKGLRNHAKSQGWWSNDKDFNFSEVFSEDEKEEDCTGKETLEQQEDNINVQTMLKILRDKARGICVDSEIFLTTASAVSVLPQEENCPCIHFLTGTPDPSRSIFKPFIFVEDVKLVPAVQSSCLGDKPCAHGQHEWKHELYEAHQCALNLPEKDQDEEERLMCIMQGLENQGLEAMEELLNGFTPLDPMEVVDLFYDCVDTELKFYK